MSTETTNLQLVKPTEDDFYDINLINGNMDKIDAAIGDSTQMKAADGTGNAIVLSIPSITAYKAYQKFTFITSANNAGGATTIKVGNLAALPLYKPNTTTTPTLIAGKAYEVWVSSDLSCFFLKASAEGNAVASNVLAGKTFSNGDDTGLVGTIPSKGAATIIPGTINQTIAAGQYLGGVQTIAGDADLVSSNIKAGANIFGVVGNSNVVDTTETTIPAAASHILTGRKAFANGALVSGSMPNQGSPTYTPGATNISMAAGYFSGGTILGDPDLISANIKAGANIFGVAGTGNDDYGDGLDGDLNTTGNVTIAAPANGSPVVKQYKNLTINAGHIMTTNVPCTGLILFCDGNCTINGTLTMSKKGKKAVQDIIRYIPDIVRKKNIAIPKGGLGGNGGGAEVATTYGWGLKGLAARYRPQLVGGAGGGGGGGPFGYSGGNNGGAGGDAYDIYIEGVGGGAAAADTSGKAGSNGGGGSGSGANTSYGSAVGGAALGAGGGGSPGGGSGTGGGTGTAGVAGEPLGGSIILIVKGTLIIGATGVVSCDGGNGGAGGNAAAATNQGGGGCGGGGAGGGTILILHKGSITNNGSMSVNGGIGGAAGTGRGSDAVAGVAGAVGTISINLIV